MRCSIAFEKNDKQILKNYYFKTLKGLRVICKIDCGRVNILDKFNNQRSNNFLFKCMFYICALKASFFTH